MVSARFFVGLIVGLAVALYPAIGIHAQSSDTGEQRAAPEPKQSAQKKSTQKQSATSSARTAKPQSPFDSLTEFSAIMIGGLGGNTDEIQIYRSGHLMWAESYNKLNHLVTDLDARESYFVFTKPKQQCLRQGGVAEQSFPFAFFRPEFKVEHTPAGEEVVDGHHCHIDQVVRTSPTGNSVQVKFWEADDLKGFPVKIELERAGRLITIVYKDVKLGPPDPKLFELPKNCRRGPEPSGGNGQ